MTPGREDRTFKWIEKDDTIGVVRGVGILEMNILTISLEGKTFLILCPKYKNKKLILYVKKKNLDLTVFSLILR